MDFSNFRIICLQKMTSGRILSPSNCSGFIYLNHPPWPSWRWLLWVVLVQILRKFAPQMLASASLHPNISIDLYLNIYIYIGLKWFTNHWLVNHRENRHKSYDNQSQCRGSRSGFRTVHRPRRIGRASLSWTSWCATRTSGCVARTSRRVAGRSYEVIGVLLHNLRRAAGQTFTSPIHIYSATAMWDYMVTTNDK